jgi:FlaA1/EpsC-like NDP-sugar epimerase
MLPKGLLREYSRALSILIRLLDVIVVFIAAGVAYIAKFDALAVTNDYIAATLAGVILAPIVFSFSNLYSAIRGRSYLSYFIALTRSVCVFALLLAGFAFITKSGETYSRVWFGIWMGTTFFFLIFYRCVLLMLLRYMRARGLNEKRAVIFGAGVVGQRFAETVQQAVWTGFRIITFIDDNAKDKPATVHHIPVINMPDNLSVYLQENNIDELWLALPLRAEKRVK